MHALLHPIHPMLGQHPLRRLAAFGLLALALFAGYVAYLWYDADDSRRTWNWEKSDAAVIGRALGEPVISPDRCEGFSDYLRNHSAEFEGRLIQLLNHSDPEVSQAAVRQLLETRTINPESLPALIAAHQRGVPVLPAIATAGTVEAVDYISAECRQKGNWTALAWNLSSAGPIGYQRLATIYREPQPVSPELHRALCEIAYTHSPSGPKDCGPWLEVALDPQSPESNRCAALELIALMGDDATEALPVLEAMGSAAPAAVAEAARQTTSRITGSGTLAGLVPRLEFVRCWKDRSYLSVGTVERIGKLGAGGHAASPLIAPLLSSLDWRLRSAAATTLGRIGCAEAVPGLITALQNNNDWALAGAAAESLARLGAKGAIPALQQTAESHWYPPVRAMAAESVQVISGQAVFPDFQRPQMYFGWYGNIALDRHVWEFSQTPPKASTALRLVRRLSCFIGNTWDRSWLWRAYRVAKTADKQLGQPDFGQAFGGGYLLGYDNGEWGGRIVYVVGNKVVREFPVENSFGFYPMPFGLVAITSDFSSNEGMIYLIKQDENGMPTCEPMQHLPFELYCGSHFAPVTRRWNRELLIIGEANESVVLTRSGTLRMAD